MKSSTKNKAAGTAKVVAGQFKQAVGKAIKSPALEAEGIVDETAGKVQKAVGALEDVIKK